MMDRPIIFSSPMVEAIVAGRKTMTRRLLKPQPQGMLAEVGCIHIHGEPWPRVWTGAGPTGGVITKQQVRFAVGMRLWVRETWAETSVAPIIETIDKPWVVYRAADSRTDYGGPWRSPIHMRRRDSRITLTVTAVKVERLQDISEEDAKTEGVEPVISGREGWSTPLKTYRTGFVRIWNTIHGEKAWLDNPYVVAVGFKSELRNIDNLQAA